MNDKIDMDEKAIKEIPYLLSITENDPLVTVITIPDNGCNQETLDLVAQFVKIKNVWNQLTVFNAENLMILADFLNLKILFEHCTLWILKEKFSNSFQFSDILMKNYPEYYDELDALFQSITHLNNIQPGNNAHLKVTVNGNDIYEKFKKVKRFSNLEVSVNGVVTTPVSKENHSMFERCKKWLGFNVKPVSAPSQKIILRVKSLFLGCPDQCEFLWKSVTLPILQKLHVKGGAISNHTVLSKALNDQRMPQLEELSFEGNWNFLPDTFQLVKIIAVKRLNLGRCGLSNVSFLERILDKMPQLEELNLYGNPEIQLNTFPLNEIPLERLSLAKCQLRNVAPLANMLKIIPLKQLILTGNGDIQLDTLQFDSDIFLRHLVLNECNLREGDLPFLTRALQHMTHLRSVELEKNGLSLSKISDIQNSLKWCINQRRRKLKQF